MVLALSTLNLQGFFYWKDREDHIIEFFEETQPDIIFLQEVTYIPEISALTQTSLLNERLAYPFENSSISRLQESPYYKNYREGLSMLSKYPITKAETIVLKKDPEDQHLRLVQFVDVMLADGQILKLANVHFSITDDTEKFARAQLEEVMEILESRNEVRIIAGDFNMRQLEIHKDLWGGQYAASSYVPYISYPSENKRMDYFLIPKEHAFQTVATSPDGLSDHRALTVKVTMGKGQRSHTYSGQAADMFRKIFSSSAR
jgi:endonuclease/exonuclease/phosphatase family metal-dependent hydrolase